MYINDKITASFCAELLYVMLRNIIILRHCVSDFTFATVQYVVHSDNGETGRLIYYKNNIILQFRVIILYLYIKTTGQMMILAYFL